MNNKYKNLVTLLLGLSICNSYAEPLIYKIKDKNGKTIYTDRLPANEKGAYTILSSKSGILKTNIEKELNKEEIQIQEQSIQEEKKIAEKSEFQRKKDTALLSTYSNVDEIEKMKKFEMNQIEQSIKNNIENIATLKEKINQLEDNSKTNPNNKKIQENTQKLLIDLEVANKNLEYNNNLLNKRNIKYDDDKSRYEQILRQMSTSDKNKKINN